MSVLVRNTPLDLLLSMQNTDGGWGPAQGLPSNTEATALAALATHASGAEHVAARDRAIGLLRRRQRADGAWAVADDVPQADWSTSLAALALGRIAGDDEATRRALRWLVEQEGRGPPFLIWLRYKLFPDEQLVELNPSYRGWPWAPHTFGWIEPTSWAIVTLKTLLPLAPRRKAQDRIRDGERMILDRMCAGGGWNYGNSRVLDKDLDPFPDTTALALIGLQHMPNTTQVQQSLKALGRMLEGNDSGLTLALSILCYRLHGIDAAPLVSRLARRFEETSFIGEARTLALATLATCTEHPFEVPR